MYYEINGNILPQVRLIDVETLEPPYVHRRRRADEYILYVLKKGTLYLAENGTDYELSEGDVILLDSDFIHQGIRASECEYYYIHFRHPKLRRRREEADWKERGMQLRSQSLQEDCGSWSRYRDSLLRFPKTVHLSGAACVRVMALLDKAMEYNFDQMENYKVMCGCSFWEAMVEIARAAVSASILETQKGMPDSVKKVHALLNYLNTSYREEISSESIEERFSCNFDYLNRVFKKTVGKTIFVYLNEMRIRRARELLGTTPAKVSAIGYRVGFRDEAYFCKVFKKYTGMSPRQYENMVSRKEEFQKPG